MEPVPKDGRRGLAHGDEMSADTATMVGTDAMRTGFEARRSTLLAAVRFLVDATLLGALSLVDAGTFTSSILFVATGLAVAAGWAVSTRLNWSGTAHAKSLVAGHALAGLLIAFIVGVTDPAFTALMVLTTLAIVATAAMRVPTGWLALLFGLAAMSSCVSVAVQDEVRLPLDSTAQSALTVAFLLWTLANVAGVHVAGAGMRSDLDESHRRLASALERLEALADRDELTGVANRRRVLAALAAERDRADRTGIGFSIAILDIDHFDLINARFGPPIGDTVLQSFATLLEGALRRHDIVGRVGIEEFLLVLPGAAGVSEAQRAAERVRAAVENHDWSAIAGDLLVTVSIGVAFSERLEPVDALLERAHRGLQRAKDEGHNRSNLEPAASL